MPQLCGISNEAVQIVEAVGAIVVNTNEVSSHAFGAENYD